MRATGMKARDRIVALGQCSDLERRAATAGEAEIVDAAIAVADALAGQAEIAEHGAEHRDHPIGLIAVLGPLQRPADRQKAGLARHPAGERADPVRLDVADRRRPVGIFWHAIALPEQIGHEALVADAMGAKELLVVQVFAVQRVRQAQHQRDIGIGADRPPVGTEKIVDVVPHRADADHLDAGVAPALEVAARGMVADAALVDLRVLHRDAAEAHHQAGMRQHVLDRRRLVHELEGRDAEHMGDDHLGRAGGVGLDGVGVAAELIEKAMQLALRMVETTSARPAIGAAEDRLVAVLGDHAAQRIRRHVQRLVPGHGDERLDAALCAIAPARPLQPARADAGSRNAAARILRGEQGLADGGGLGCRARPDEWPRPGHCGSRR